eukprot:472513-Hanusia_phi.AAC.5
MKRVVAMNMQRALMNETANVPLSTSEQGRTRVVEAQGTARRRLPQKRIVESLGAKKEGFTMRLYDFVSECERGPGADKLCPLPSMPDDVDGLPFLGEAVVPDINFNGIGSFRSFIPQATESFLAVWWGLLPIELFDRYTFCAQGGADGIRVFVDGRLVTNNDGRGLHTRACGSVNLLAGDHYIRVDAFASRRDIGYYGVYKQVTYYGTRTVTSESQLKSTDATPLAVMPQTGLEGFADVTPGYQLIVYTFYPALSPPSTFPNLLEHSPFAHALMDKLEVSWSDIVGKCDDTLFPETGSVAFTLAGRFKITYQGIYKFCLRSVEGSRLHVDGSFLIESDGAAPVDSCKELPLRQGVHTIHTETFKKATPKGAKVKVTYSGRDTNFQQKLVESFDARYNAGQPAPTNTKAGFRMFIFETHSGSPAAMGWQDPAMGQVCTPPDPRNNQVGPLSHAAVYAPPRYCEYSIAFDPSKAPLPGLPNFCCYTPPWLTDSAPLSESIVPAINFGSIADLKVYNPKQTSVKFGWKIYGSYVARESRLYSICIYASSGARLWIGTAV